LLETLVAFSILALSLGVILRIFGGGAFMTSKSDEHARAVNVAESLLAKLACESCPLPPGDTSGEIDETYRWTLSVSPFDMGNQPQSPNQASVEAVWVDLTVEWGDQDASQDFSLGTLRLHGKQAGRMGSGQ
jgi:general secretion pathway protein I